ncbi:RNA polymerase sigma factor (sigma-70 family) [Microbacteriaceae bacterium SG_E_30_P1]|uniref:RNA polymerase sigma factor (Sigma-70 family) n=1 Tax=Antiquaquibacter oligotrophicus TaxID=2880260 RepID=A0ABT6KQM4_9MICO|nr:sigma-70 family RNA polymerase sigma factor [Antiquaquibacter oligotrophicus]MDH6182285.1 RNA polymerase sigma factor (sigma-70 family) [Antiquaquibacter oligotrophicus]UDF12058.1 sigma-70 family RNA polymerase sigma factor [Antiquaquibacter oligotrophicus]
MLETDVATVTSDAELIERIRSGDTRAFGELWQRHYRPAYRAAQQFSRTIEPDDLISEAYLRVYQQLLAGKGPTSAFRPYLYSVIRNVAMTRSAAAAKLATDPLYEDPVDPRHESDQMLVALERSITTKAFRALPERWQTVLWYTEIEGMDPHEVAPLMGISANGVAALALRAREGLRQTWLQAHVGDDGNSDECQWATSKMGGYARRSLGSRDTARIERHLGECTKCLLVSAEIEEIGSRLAFVMIPLVLGGVAGVGYLQTLTQPSMTAMAESILPSLPEAAETAAHNDAMAPALIGTFSLAMVVGRRAMLVAIIGSVILVGSLAIGFSRALDPAPGAPMPAPVSVTP